MQEKWYRDYLLNKNEITFAIDETDSLQRMVGSLSLYNFEYDKAEIGKIQIGDPEAHGRGIGKKVLVMAMAIGFEKLGLKTIVGFVHRGNISAHKNDISIGFKITGEHESAVGGIEDEISIDFETLKAANEYVNDIIIKE